MAQEKPFDLPVVQAWLSAWNERDIFSDAAVRHPQCLIMDPLCLVVVTLGGREPRSLLFRRMKQMIPVLIPPLPALKPTVYAVHGDNGRFQIHTEKRQGGERTPGKRDGQSVGNLFVSRRSPPSFFLKWPLARSRRSPICRSTLAPDRSEVGDGSET
jgi:hypothetical protein